MYAFGKMMRRLIAEHDMSQIEISRFVPIGTRLGRRKGPLRTKRRGPVPSLFVSSCAA